MIIIIIIISIIIIIVITIFIWLINKCNQLLPLRSSRKMLSSGSEQNEDQDNVNYDELPDCIGMEERHSGDPCCKDECIEQKSNNSDSIPSN